ncbi:MFS transporter [Streptomyces canus]|uniref:MFS transporter n=1 Tax=Streptomyces canus TaxID=58343 RepID=UPI00368FF35C
MPGSNDTPKRPWRTAVLAGMASYLDAGALVTSGIAIGGYYAAPLHLGSGTIGALLGLQTLAFAVGALFGGRLGDRFGRRKIFTLSLGLYAAGVLVLMAADGPALLYTGVVATGLAIGADLPVSLALVNEEAPAGKKGTMVVFSGMLWLAGIVVVLMLSSFMGTQGMLGGRILFAHLLLVAVVVLVLRRTTLGESAEWAAARRAADTHTPSVSDTIEFSRIRDLFRAPTVHALLATGLYYAAWNLGANTLGQFGTFLWTALADGEVAQFSRLALLGLPIGFAAGLLFLRVVDTPARHAWFAVGSALIALAWALPALLGPSKVTLVAVMFISGLGNSFAGESIYKVWSQELFPTLLRATAGGVTMAFTRAVAGLAALGTPAFALGHARLMFGCLFGLVLVAAVIGLVWVPRLSEAPTPEEPTARDVPAPETTAPATV